MAVRLNGAYPTRNTSGLLNRSIDANVGSSWVRPADWLTLPTVTASDQKFVGLHAVYPDANFVALTAAGDYTVDWGDGTVENFFANAVAQHEYNYSTYDTGNATLTNRGYKQAIVVVTPQSGQNLTVLNLNQRHSSLSVAYSSGFLDIAIASEFLTDLRIGGAIPGSTAQNIRFADLEQVNIVRSDLRTLDHLFYLCNKLQSVVNLSVSNKASGSLSVTFTDSGDVVTSVAHGLRNGDAVILLSLVSTTGLTVDTRYFVISATADTFQLSTAFNGAAVTLTTDGTGQLAVGLSMVSLFLSCSTIENIPLFDMKNTINASSMFSGCSNIKGIPFFDTSSVIDFSVAFNQCRSLIVIPKINTSSARNTSNMFSNCSSIVDVPLFDTSNARNMNSMFAGCTGLKEVPLLNTSSATNLASMFNGCSSLVKVPAFNTASVTLSMSLMFNGCTSLNTVPAFNTSNVANFGNMFFNCTSLNKIPSMDFTAATSLSNIFLNCNSLTRIEATNFKLSFSVANCKLSATALNEIYTNLPTVTGQTITVTGNYGAASDDPTIATAKGWTVTG